MLQNLYSSCGQLLLLIWLCMLRTHYEQNVILHYVVMVMNHSRSKNTITTLHYVSPVCIVANSVAAKLLLSCNLERRMEKIC